MNVGTAMMAHKHTLFCGYKIMTIKMSVSERLNVKSIQISIMSIILKKTRGNQKLKLKIKGILRAEHSVFRFGFR